ncbi:MAG: hypothetical protein RLY16_2543 [Bacteroidota bacterium]
MQYSNHHKFHIPVLGLAYTIDSPIKVAQYGISSVISIIEDRLIELMRKHYYPATPMQYQPISAQEKDYKAKRITDYLNLVNTIVQNQVKNIKEAAFEKGTEIVKYFEMLPEENFAKQLYRKMMSTDNSAERVKLEALLRAQIIPGSIDVNIMTKVDGDRYTQEGELIENGSDAIAALRGFVNSDLENSSVIFSAGLNPRLFNYLESCTVFQPNEAGEFTKKIVVKVSDFRSALIQGKYLAKKGIWVSEFRIESGLNCGGHAFVSDGYLLGPILEEFKTKRAELIQSLFEIYQPAIEAKYQQPLTTAPKIIFTVQGGIGTHEEDAFLKQYYQLDGTGWGTPFLLVPEATTVDDNTLQLLCAAQKEDIELSNNSPLGVRFHYLKGTTSDIEKQTRIAAGKPGSPCTEKHLAFNTEFTKEPICTASHKYQKLKIAELETLNLPQAEHNRQLKEILGKECLCVGLSNAASLTCDEVFIKNLKAVTVCPGPNIVNFSKVVSLQTMTDHIYGRTNILSNAQRPHMFINELILNIDYLQEQFDIDHSNEQVTKKKKFYSVFIKNLLEGIAYYRDLPIGHAAENEIFNMHLDAAEERIKALENLIIKEQQLTMA